MTKESISESGGGGQLTFRPGERLPEDSYELRIYVDGKLAKTQPFVIDDGDSFNSTAGLSRSL